MSQTNNTCPYRFQDPDDYRRLHDHLSEINYSQEGIQDLLGRSSHTIPKSADLPPLLRLTNGRTPLETLVRLFLIRVEVDMVAAKQAFGPFELENCVQAGLITINNDKVSGGLNLLPFNDLFIGYDSLRELETGGCRPDWVMGIGSSTITLANLTIRRQGESMLDLCAGCGYHALLGSHHCDQVVAVDSNPRATALSVFNAMLNQIDNVQSKTGNLFEPVANKRFDLIVCNPPFVISPSSKYIYRDSGLRGDEFCRNLAAEAPNYMEEDGYFLMLFNWAHYANQDWKERLNQAFEGIGCDIWIMHNKIEDISNYASKWLKHTDGDDGLRFANAYEQWMSYYEKQQIEAISGCTLIMRRRTAGDNWFCLDDSLKPTVGPIGNDVHNAFKMHDYLEAISDEGLLDEKLLVSSALRMRQKFQPQDGAWTAGGNTEIFLAEGLRYTNTVDMYIARFLARCNGENDVRTLVGELAETLGEEFDFLAQKFLKLVRTFIQQAILKPQEDSTTVPGN